ncbi:MAG: copper-binding protein [Betaproteobacteria bacterium]|nr:copper-binding protein [Betaproteobacteria bacterium]
MKRLALCVIVSTFAALAAAQHAHHAPAATPVAQSTATAPSDGEVRKVDKANGRITIRHGEIPNIGMGPMTMVFGVKSPALLDKVAAGDKVKFRVEEIKGDYVVTMIEKAK